jgi:hypothetical protein
MTRRNEWGRRYLFLIDKEKRMGKKIVRPNDRELGKRTAHTGSEAQEERAGSGTDTRLPYIYIGCCSNESGPMFEGSYLRNAYGRVHQ